MRSLRNELVSALQRAETAHIEVWVAANKGDITDMTELKSAENRVSDVKCQIIAVDPMFDFSGLMSRP